MSYISDENHQSAKPSWLLTAYGCSMKNTEIFERSQCTAHC